VILVFSAALSAFLLFGYPAYLLTQKQYSNAFVGLLVSLVTFISGGLLIIWLVYI